MVKVLMRVLTFRNCRQWLDFESEKHHKSLFFSPCQVFTPPYFHRVMRTREIYIPKQPFQLKTSLDHLPNHKRYEINGIMLSIKELAKPEMIILFGSYSRGDWVDERYYDENRTLHEYKSDYDFLVVTEHHQDMPPGLGKRIRQRVKRQERLQASPNIIFFLKEYQVMSGNHYQQKLKVN